MSARIQRWAVALYRTALIVRTRAKGKRGWLVASLVADQADQVELTDHRIPERKNPAMERRSQFAGGEDRTMKQ